MKKNTKISKLHKPAKLTKTRQTQFHELQSLSQTQDCIYANVNRVVDNIDLIADHWSTSALNEQCDNSKNWYTVSLVPAMCGSERERVCVKSDIIHNPNYLYIHAIRTF